MQTSKNYQPQGFSLMEMLIVIAIIGIIANIAVVAFGSVSTTATEMKDRRNAQEIATIAAAARAAGADFVVPTDKSATVENLVAGTTPSRGIFKGRRFALPSMGESDLDGAMDYLAFNGNELIYKQE
jgi:prepilin-type N-terminal cleavage/methylation domain-containing protein